MDGPIRTDGAVALWQELLQEGESRAHVRLSEDVEAYLVFLLMRHMRDGALAGRTMALEWLQALDLDGSRRSEALRDVGDRCLLISGWYPRLADRRRVSRTYFEDIGRSAYGEAADSRQDALGALFGQLAEAYRGMVRVLAATLAATDGTMTLPELPGALAPVSFRPH